MMPLASSLGASHEDQSVAPLFANSYMQASKQQLVMTFSETVLKRIPCRPLPTSAKGRSEGEEQGFAWFEPFLGRPTATCSLQGWCMP